MDLEYDRKFEEMKKYIPFLENMIKRLESTSSGPSNPRQAQLDKIRSLRDLLLDKKKRMKMENLLKCEQVLVNLYAKVEQRPTSPNTTITTQTTKPKEENNLEVVRNKLKSVVSKTADNQETLPEIARANIVEETCTPGSKEPALFQRRPNKTSQKSPNNSASSTSTKRNYTRVLLSPEPSNRRWENEETSDKALFSRRSPRRSPKRYSPTYNRKERKKSKQSQGKKGKGLNITLNVPEERLDSWNSKDILSRIMNCNDNDVDIETLREAKRQILNELKQTGANCDDISDLLLKSYKKSKSGSITNKKDDVEEGELSDSESEAISSIYDNFILDDGTPNSSKKKDCQSEDKPRKIQICLVINSDKDGVTSGSKNDTSMVSRDTGDDDFEMFEKKPSNIKRSDSEKGIVSTSPNQNNKDLNESPVKADSKEVNLPAGESLPEDRETKCKDTSDESKPEKSPEVSQEIGQPANFYKPLKDEKQSIIAETETSSELKKTTDETNNAKLPEQDRPLSSSDSDDLPEIAAYLKSTESDRKESVEIPLLHDQSVATQRPKKDVVSEIDILQALKNEILGEPISIPGSETTPVMHQPKLTKVASVQEIVPKKRISIEKYKKMSVPSVTSTNSLFVNDPTFYLNDDSNTLSKEENLKKQSLKLTEKECERFNFPTKLTLDDDDDDLSDADLEADFSLNDIYENLAPKSPDNNEAPSVKNVPPVIIPIDPVKTALAPSKADVDMRKLPQNISPASSSFEIKQDKSKQIPEKSKLPADPRMRRDLSQTSDKEHPTVPRQTAPPVVNYSDVNPCGTPRRPLLMTPNMAPNLTPNRAPNMTPTRVPNMTPSIAPNMTPSMTPNMTPSRNPNMTPNSRTFDIGNRHHLEIDENPGRKHVYAPMFPLYDQRESREHSVAKEPERRSHWDQPEKEREPRRRDARWVDSSESRDANFKREPRSSSIHREMPDYSKSRYGESYNNYDNYNSRFNDRRESYSRSDCPRTPLPSFGRSDGPMTPVHTFGRMDCPSTPSHPFGRLECPLTPSHQFGRSECPQTPSHPFGRPDFSRNDGSMTPNHSFGRVEMPLTPIHPFGRTEPQCRDPRLNRGGDYDDNDRNQYRDRNQSSYNNSYWPDSKKMDSYRSYRERSVGRGERCNYSEDDSRNYNREETFRRDSSVGRATSRDIDNERLFSKDRHGYPANEYHHKSVNIDARKGFEQERSVGRGISINNRMHHSSSRNYDNIRASSVGRTTRDFDSRLSVKPHTGSSFTIDTSIRSTFQDFLRDDKIEVLNSFDGRRKRASSVGRTLYRESSVGRSLPNQPKPSFGTTPEYTERNKFRRARSVGRDILASEKERSFKDIKEDFENFYKQSNKLKQFDKTSDTRDPRRNSKYLDCIPSKKDLPEKIAEPSSKKQYSPRKNIRDPRVRRDLQHSKSKYKYENSRERERKNVGIVYSNDNITKGTILGSGYGVKNYKIPKIKRPVEEEKQIEEEKEMKKKEESKIDIRVKERDEKISDGYNKKKVIRNDKSKIVKNKVLNDKSKEKCDNIKKREPHKPEVEIDENSEKRVTRLSKKSSILSPSSNDITLTNPKKIKKHIIIDSDEDLTESEKEDPSNIPKIPYIEKQSKMVPESSCSNDLDSLSKNTKTCTSLQNKKQEEDISNDKNATNEKETDQEESNFAIDDLEIFSDNLVSDPVIDNINALIEDLDNDLGPSKTFNSEFSDDKSLNTIFDNLVSGKNDVNTAEELSDISEVIKRDLNKSTERFKDDSTLPNTEIKESVENESDKAKSLKFVEKSPELVAGTSTKEPVQRKQSTNDDTVSTSEMNKVGLPEEKDDKNETLVEGSSTPDSTNEVDTKKHNLDDSLPDSTNEAQTDANSLVTSSHDSVETGNKDNVEPSSPNKQSSSINSIGNILSLLQNKSKLKEMLSLLGDTSSENEKIKKKLEKLSEIVSDEDEDVSNDQGALLNESKDQSSKTNEKDEHAVEQSTKINQTKDNNDLPEESSIEPVDDSTLKQFIEAKKSEEELLENITEKNDESVVRNEQEIKTTKKQLVKKGKIKRRGRGRAANNFVTRGAKRITRSAISRVKKPSRELMKLQEDLKEMFISDDVLNATGIRMCRLAKLVDDSNSKTKEDVTTNDSGPVVVLEKFKDMEITDETLPLVKLRKKPGPKKKAKLEESIASDDKTSKHKSFAYKPGPKSKTKQVSKSDDEDPYAFESDSLTSENNDSLKSHKEHSSDSESDSLASSQSFGSTDLLVESKKKPKRKRSAWQSGVIKPKNRKKKSELKPTEIPVNDNTLSQKPTKMPDFNCFTDKTYCFYRNVSSYSCRMCNYNGEDIVNHYKQHHPHSEIPLSRLSVEMAREAIEQCEEINFQAISKIPSDKYVCRFCFKEFGRKSARKKCILEEFFWHVVSMHTGEYKQSCSLCVTVEKCPYSLDIPPPPKDVKGQLIGYICEKCNFTQISLENLKTHVIVRHNDEQTEVYTINLAVMSRKAISALTRRCSQNPEKLRVLRSGRSNQSLTEASDDQSEVTDSDHSSEPLSTKKKSLKESLSPTPEKNSNINMLSKIAFENDDNESEPSTPLKTDTVVKKELVEDGILNNKEIEALKNNLISEICGTIDKDAAGDANSIEQPKTTTASVPAPVDINDYPHFKISFTDSGSKEYICCVNRVDYHYKTTLLISMKKHVQIKHSENWDGYCYLCKVIVTPQGRHSFKDCFQHYLDKHMDEFPVVEKIVDASEGQPDTAPAQDDPIANKPYINVRPISELMSKEAEVPPLVPLPTLPKIENVMSLGAPTVEPCQPSPSYPPILAEPSKEAMREYKYEEVQAVVMSKKHRVVLDTMMNPSKLVNVFKCAGRYCSFTSDSAEEALVHASTHKRVGGESSLICSYCDFDCSGNAIDLVMHVFKAHECCPYVCGYCFYRGAASQLVTAHISRIHKDLQPNVLSVPNVAPPLKDSSMLTREAVVQYYVCPHACKFKAYTAGKYCEHLIHQHCSELSHPCYICKDSFLTPHQLIQHMKCHELNVYQCTWCVHGADTETSLLFHASQKHPEKQPQAYLRVIQKLDKDGSVQLRVLPLVSFNKTKVSVIEVAPVVSKENSVREAEREAERSIELEKLIGHTTQLIESSTPARSATPRPPTETESAVTSIMDAALLPDAGPPAAVIDPGSLAVTPPPKATPPPSTEISEQVTPKIKAEPVDETPKKRFMSEIVCLDTDDENSMDSRDESLVIALSDEEATESSAKTDKDRRIVPAAILLKCPACLMAYKSVASFKRHTNTCAPPDGHWNCPHCSCKLMDRDDIIKHYYQAHTADKGSNVCKLCDCRFANLTAAKSHMRTVHNVSKIIVERVDAPGKEVECVLSAAPAPLATLKRKQSTGAGPETPPKLKRYGPQDVESLPINPILDELVACSTCEFKTKVRLNMVRHLQLHAERQPAPSTAPINPVPHLETNEKHFDKMVNLASSSIVTRAPEKPARPEPAGPVQQVPAEAASRYPRYVAERQRHACGARNCSYISLDEAMLRCHWDTLHTSTNDFRCVHCPPYQHLDTSKPLTSARIIAHLKMHDSTLYACSSCAFYHYKKQVLEKHLADVHKGSARLMVVREEAPAAAPGAAPAPTMDLKPWHCGLCSYQNMLRPEVVEHCAKAHMSKMQFKCFYCPFRTSALENVTKHQSNAHPKKPPEVFYYYYREGSFPEDTDGTPRWMKQRQKFALNDPEIKSENEPDSSSTLRSMSLTQLLTAPPKHLPPSTSPPVDLNIVKKEIEDPVGVMSVEQLLSKYGAPCEPNGLRYKCPLCKAVTEDTQDAMQSHLYEELKYRKWVCSKCSYKAFHITGLNNHIASEHRGQMQESIQLPIDVNIEKWVAHILEHQTNAIAKNKENFSKQKIVMERPVSTPSSSTEKSKTTQEQLSDRFSMQELEQAFGPMGVPSNMMFCCPKCDFKVKDEATMRDHLETELTKIRWSCSSCSDKFQTYHEAQFHCKSVHAGGGARPQEAPRDPARRAAWARAAASVQRLTMNTQPAALDADPAPAAPAAPQHPPVPDDLLVVRFEKTIPPPEESLHPRKRPAEPQKSFNQCPHCDYKTKYNHVIREHMYRHFDLKPYFCVFCDFSASRSSVVNHLNTVHHKYQPDYVRQTPLPSGSPPVNRRLNTDTRPDEASTSVSMVFDSDDDEVEMVRKVRKVARKSTTKLPAQAVAKKSTTKLPYGVSDAEILEEYTCYGTKPPSPSKYENVTTLMSFYNTMVPFTMKKLSEVIKINPCVRVEDFRKKFSPPK